MLGFNPNDSNGLGRSTKIMSRIIIICVDNDHIWYCLDHKNCNQTLRM